MRKTPLRSISEKRRAQGTKTGMMRRPSMPRGKKKARKPRKASETKRCHGPKGFAAFVSSLPCIVCVALHPVFAFVTGRSHNAHVVTGGMGKKSDWTNIVPLCTAHHKCYDEHRYPLDTPAMRQFVRDSASRTVAAWLAFSGRQERDA